MSNQTDYETLYGVGFLDDLHNYFPAILYDSGRFHSVSELLTYIQQCARNRFDLFSFGQRAYISRNPPPPPQPVSQSILRPSILNAIRSTLETSPISSHSAPMRWADLSGNRVESDTEDENGDTEGENGDTEEEVVTPPVGPSHSVEPSTAPRQERIFEYVADSRSDDAALQIVNLLLGTSIPPITNIRSRRINLDIGADLFRLPQQFMEPVVVRPTQEQIAAASESHNASEVMFCSVCQSNIQPNEVVRRLNACNHSFHDRCIDTWFEQDVHCPICRHDIRETNTTENNRPVS